MRKITVVLLLLLMTASAACGGDSMAPLPTGAPTAAVEQAAATSEPAEAPAEPPVGEVAAAGCPEPTDDTYLLRDPRHGFCLLYPASHKVERPNPDEVVLVVGGLLNAGDPRAMITATPSDGRTAADLADEIAAGFEGFEIERSESRVAGEPAIVLDNLPGQDINRRVIFEHEGLLYHIYFSPIDPANPAPLNAFIAGILDTFTFIPASETVTAEDECVAPKPDEQQILSEALGYCFLIPADFTYEEPGDTNANLFVGSIMNVEQPKLFIEVTGAEGRTAAAAADELVASFEGFEIPRTFGDTLGYEPAERLDGVPGQDLGRVLLAVHGDRLYRLTFVPADPTQEAVYEQMEALFAKALNSFRFLP